MSVNRSMLSIRSVTSTGTAAMISGTADSDYPVTNLTDLKHIRKPFQTTGSGAISFKVTLSANATVRFLALVHHYAGDPATYRFRCYSDTGLSSLVDDSGTLTFPETDDDAFRLVTPYELPSDQSVRAVRVDLSDLGDIWSIGGVEIAHRMAWEGVTKRTLGFDNSGEELQRYVDGATFATRAFSPRIIGTGRENQTYSDEGWTIMDLQKVNGRSEPFVWVRAYEDATTWNRECALVRLRSLAGISRKFDALVDYELSLEEHLR
jgi:hypothetical protein